MKQKQPDEYWTTYLRRKLRLHGMDLVRHDTIFDNESSYRHSFRAEYMDLLVPERSLFEWILITKVNLPHLSREFIESDPTAKLMDLVDEFFTISASKVETKGNVTSITSYGYSEHYFNPNGSVYITSDFVNSKRGFFPLYKGKKYKTEEGIDQIVNFLVFVKGGT